MEIKQIYKSAWSVNGQYILKRYSGKAALEKSIALSELLLPEGVPVPEYCKRLDGASYVRAGNAYYVLMKKIKGRHMNPYRGRPYRNGVMLGRLVARLHMTLQAVENKIECPDADYMRELDDWILPNLDDIKPAREIVAYCRSFGPLYHSLPRQLIHRDVHTGNLLFRGRRLTGILDFDNSQINARLHDLCYLGATAPVGNYQKEKRLRRWRKIFRGILSGYHEKLELTSEEYEAVPSMFVFIELNFAAFFAKTGRRDIAKSCMEMTEWLYLHREEIA